MNNIKFEEKNATLSALKLLALSGRLPVAEILMRFYKQLDDMALNPDMLPTTIDTYETILLQLPESEIKKSIEYIFYTYPSIVIRDNHLLLLLTKTHPQITSWVFNKLIKHASLDMTRVVYILTSIIENAPNTEKIPLVDALLTANVDKNTMFSNIGVVYNSVPGVRQKIYDAILTGYDKNTNDGLQNIIQILLKLKPYLPTVLDVIEDSLNNPNIDKDILKQIIEIVGFFHTEKYDVVRTTNILNEIKRNIHAKNLDVLRTISRQDGTIVNKDILRSFAYFGERVPKSEKNSDGWIRVAGIAPDERCVLILGGNATFTDRGANGYLKNIDEFFQSHGIHGVGLYAVFHDFGHTKDIEYSFNDYIARHIQMKKYGRRVKKDVTPRSYDDEDPQYIKQIFNCIFLPRISNNGKKIDFKIAAERIRKITVVAHCHGGYTFVALEELMWKTMHELGYSEFECAQIQKQLLCIAHAPYCPLGISKSTMVSFMSARDEEVHHFNAFESMIRTMDIQKTAFFPEKLGDVFIAPNITTESAVKNNMLGPSGLDHSFLGYDFNSQNLTEHGKLITKFAANALASGVRGQPITSIKDLVTNNGTDLVSEFDCACKYGNELYSQILAKSIAKYKKSRD